jgi:acylglycerol lipase
MVDSTVTGARSWSYISGAFRLAFHRRAPRPLKQTLSEIRWALEAADPASPILCGVFTATDGAAIPYRFWPGENPRACVVLLHGAFDYSGAFDEIGPKFAACGIAAFAYDQRGFGATRSRRHWCGQKRMVKDLVEAVAHVRARLEGLPIFVVGESMGAAVAVHAAANTPDLDVRGLVLVAPGAVAGSVRRMFASLLVGLLNFFAPKSEITIERLGTGELTAAAAIRLVCDPLVLRSIGPNMAFGLLELAASAVDKARKVTRPTLTMVGSKENFLNTKCIAQLHKSIAGEKSWHIFQGGPHLLLHWIEADSVLAKILAWIDARIPEQRQRGADGTNVPANEAAGAGVEGDQRAGASGLGATV